MIRIFRFVLKNPLFFAIIALKSAGLFAQPGESQIPEKAVMTYAVPEGSPTAHANTADQVSLNIDYLEAQQEKQKETAHEHWRHIQELSQASLADHVKKSKKENTESTKKSKKEKKAEKNKAADEQKRLLLAAFSDIPEEEKVAIAFDLFEKHDALNHPLYTHEAPIVDDTTYRDLDIFCGKPGKPAHNFVARTKNTHTAAGTAAYIDLLYCPTTNSTTLLARQQGISQLVNDENLYKTLHEKLETLAKTETKLLALWHKNSAAAVANLQHFYVEDPIPALGSERLQKKLQSTNDWLSKKANQSATYLEAKRVFELATKPIFDVTSLAFNFSKKLLSMVIRNPLLLLSDSRIEKVVINATLLASTWYLPEEYRLNAFRIISGGEMLYWTGTSYDKLYKREQLALTLHQIMHEIASFVLTAQEIIELVKSHDALYAAVCTQRSPHLSQNPELKTCLTALTSDYFKKEPRLWGNRGTMFATFAQLQEVKNLLIPHYTCVGAIDALMSIATLVKKDANAPAHYAYAQYETHSDKPRIQLHHFWNPFIDGALVTNTIFLAGTNGILTGPNAGGKSTTLKAIALAALLGQTITVTPGLLKFTPFGSIITLLNMTDTAGQESGFQAHTARVKYALEKLKNTPAHEFVFLTPDELYNTTAQESASPLCRKLFTHITTHYPNALFLAATHFADLSSLERETEGRILNYKMTEADIIGDDLVWPYTIERGINTQNIAQYITRKLLSDLPV